MVIIFLAGIVFHLLVLSGIVSYQMVWGGRLRSSSEMLWFEVVSVGLNFGFLVVALAESGVLMIRGSGKVLKIIVWVMVGVFCVKIIGNIASINSAEKMIFTPVTGLLAVLSFVLAVSKK
ncbi:MAG: hypothetical protein NT163_06780 [Chlorobiales bacterium]|nr:hypothetical protein [Chlorobiales bacterium]